jgi:hypothetical protein
MKKLDVPYFRQHNKGECVVACAKMVMGYYGVNESYEKMLQAFNFYSVGESMGLSTPQLGSYLISKGLKAEIDTLNPYLFNSKDIGKTQSELHQKIKTLEIENYEFEKIKNYFLNFIEMGGKLNARNITKETIKEAIDNNQTVIIPLVSRMVYSHREGYNFHSNVLFGYNDKNFFLHDPEEPDYGGGTHEADQDLVINAIHMMGYADFDNASITKISP